MADEPWLALPFEEALAYLRGLNPVTKDVFDTYDVEAQAQAFTASRVLKLDLLQNLLESIQEAASTGMTIDDFVSVFSESGLTDAHLETIFRSNLESAYGRGLWDQMNDPDVADVVWGWRYRTAGDDRVREEHAELDGMEFATGEGDEVWPPWDYSCRCTSEIITNSEAEKDGIKSSVLPDNVRAALGDTEFSSPALGATYEPDLSAVDVGLIAQYVNDQAENQ